MTELLAQIPAPDLIVLSTSSGGTQAGLIAGCRLHGLSTRVVGISADDPSAAIAGEVRRILGGLEALLGMPSGALTDAPIEIDDRFVGDGYGVPDAAVDRSDRAVREARGAVPRSDLHGKGDGRAHRAGRARASSARARLSSGTPADKWVCSREAPGPSSGGGQLV